MNPSVIKILSNLYVSNSEAASSRCELSQFGITRVLSCDEVIVHAHSRIQFRRVSIQEVPQHCEIIRQGNTAEKIIPSNLFDVLPQCFEFIDCDNNVENNAKDSTCRTLVYCQR